ncbi:MAG: YXWGXW repeat-containing protein [Terriglobia bacterium]
MWTPGYWGYSSAGYYWIPGAWVLAPYVGALWTPPYWAFVNGRYLLHQGYWGPHVGFYGGINYGAGYVGRGYEGGYWNKGNFEYNRSVNRINTRTIHNIYNYKVNDEANRSRVSYNGGRGGRNTRPTAAESAVLHERRTAPIRAQVQHRQQASTNRGQFASVNHGHPQVLTAARPLATTYKAPTSHPSAVPGARTLPKANARHEGAPTKESRTRTRPAAHTAKRAAPSERAESRRNPVAHASAPRTNKPAAETRPTPQPRVEHKSTPQPRTEEHSARQPRVEQRPAPREEHQEARHTSARPSKPAPRSTSKPAPKHRDAHETDK